MKRIRGNINYGQNMHRDKNETTNIYIANLRKRYGLICLLFPIPINGNLQLNWLDRIYLEEQNNVSQTIQRSSRKIIVT